MEGVMMRGRASMATAVRDADGIIRVESKRLVPLSERNVCYRIPVVRGVLNFFGSFVTGMKILMRSAEVYGEGEPSKFEKWLSEKLKINLMTVVTGFAAVLGVLLAIGLFVLLPQVAAGAMEKAGWIEKGIAYNFIEGGFRILIFILYLLLVSLIKDIRRTFQYHGAEHMTINCYEKGLELTVENARTCSRVHNRCGTTFLFFVMLISILVFSLANYQGGNFFVRFLIKIALLPVVAGLSYELLKGLARTDFFLFWPLKAPGLLLQRITTSVPDDDMLEVAITAFRTVEKMDADPSIPERKFTVSLLRPKLLEETAAALKAGGIEEEAEAEWIVSLTLGIKRDEVREEKLVNPKYVEEVRETTRRRLTGMPLWYVTGDTDFYGFNIKVDGRALIPRPETEELVACALESVRAEDTVLDLCTGSGAIAVALSKKSGAAVTASDVSADALALARENAERNGAEIEFVESDYFHNLQGRKFSVIVSNPPYIPARVIGTLQREVRDFEPRLALDGGEDGLDGYRAIAAGAPRHLYDGGMLFLEIGEDQGHSVRALLCDFSSVEVIKDINGKDRIVRAVL